MMVLSFHAKPPAQRIRPHQFHRSSDTPEQASSAESLSTASTVKPTFDSGHEISTWHHEGSIRPPSLAALYSQVRSGPVSHFIKTVRLLVILVIAFASGAIAMEALTQLLAHWY